MRAEVGVAERASSGSPDAGATEAPQGQRLHWIDWLRVAAIASVLAYHTLRPFNTDDWHVKNSDTSATLNMAMTIFSSFGLAVLFLLAGVGVRFALRKRSWRTFIRERTTRLLVPFVAGTLLLSPIQGWLEATQKGTTPNPAVDLVGWWSTVIAWALARGFSPTVFGVGYHLWFLGFLFGISVVALPLCLWLLGARGRGVVDGLARRLDWPGSSLAFVVPIYVLMGIGTIFGTEEHDWLEFAWYFGYFVAGFVLLGDRRLIDGVRRDLWIALPTAVVATVLIVAGIPVPLDDLGSAEVPQRLATGALFALEGWTWTLVVLNLGLRAGRLQRPVSERVGDAVLPVYVIHQPVILAVAFVVVTWPLGITMKWVVLVAISLPVTLLLVALALRIPLTRVLLGTRVRPSSTTTPARSAAALTATAPPPEVPGAQAG